jgi:hypothetical protein
VDILGAAAMRPIRDEDLTGALVNIQRVDTDARLLPAAYPCAGLPV